MLVLGWVPLKQISRQDFEDEKLVWKVILESTARKWGSETGRECILQVCVTNPGVAVSEGDSNTLGVGADRQVSESFHQRSKGAWVLTHLLPFRVMTATRRKWGVEN